MTAKHFNYYGYDKETYFACIDLIHVTNRKHILILNTWFLIVNVLYLIFSALNLFGVTQERIPFYVVYTTISLALELWIGFFPQFTERHNRLMIDTNIALMVSYGILASVAQPYMPATMFLILLALISLSFIGTMYEMLVMTFLGAGIFLFTSFTYKTFSIASHDLYNVIIVLTLVIGLHYTFQRTRMEHFVLYQKNLLVQRELEIKSSFDALTSLLNRGRFFSLADTMLKQVQDEYMVICLLDLDGFKQINDNLGHQMGDKVIQVVGKTILTALHLDIEDRANISSWDLQSPRSFAGRLGGDEFIMLIRGMQTQAEITTLLKGLLETLNAVRFDGLDGIHASIGVTELTAANKDIDNAYKCADEALYASKRAGKNQIHFSGQEQAV